MPASLSPIALGASLLAASVAGGRSLDPARADGRTVEIDGTDLVLAFPEELDGFRDNPDEVAGSDQLAGLWSGELDGCDVAIKLWLLPTEEFGFSEPGDVNELIAMNYRKPGRAGGSAGFFWLGGGAGSDSIARRLRKS